MPKVEVSEEEFPSKTPGLYDKKLFNFSLFQ
jgi:hypothetical protein